MERLLLTYFRVFLTSPDLGHHMFARCTRSQEAFEQVLVGMFGDLSLDLEVRKKSMFFGCVCPTMSLFADGRRPSASHRMQGLLTKFT